MEEFSRPLISICIPTYNRAEVLRKSLETYVNNNGFDKEIEIVISDNASTDNTKEVGESFSSKYPNIKYFRNEINVRDENFPLSLDRATGEYLKLMKDNILISSNGLCYLKQIVKDNKASKKPIFFTNGVRLNSSSKESIICNDFDDFVVHTSYYVTAITFWGCWSEDWKMIKDRTKYSYLQLSQDDWAYQLLERKKEAVLYLKRYFSLLDLAKGKRGGYNWFKVHVENYYEILKPYVEKGLVSSKALVKEKRTHISGLKSVLVVRYLYNYPKWNFDFTGSTSILWRYFKQVPRYYLLMATLPIWGTKIVIENEVRFFLIKHGLWDYVNKKILKRI